ncbi:MAG: (Fe-S)-binding protein [Rhodospirillales bacterium]|nr:(Fe-S)-binding protein [Alphaproteobacteria bacterium]MBL6948865.1 (Fe-S)-binding protein [Rhodospirillales bacterium]
MSETPARQPSIGLFATCLVDLTRPSVGFAAAKLLEDAGCKVSVPGQQSCCGQPAYNSGDAADARAIAQTVIRVFEGFDYVVAPSGSCAGMIRHHYPALFENDAKWLARARALADKTHELTSFLVDVMKVDGLEADYDGVVTYHDSCSGLREMGVRDQPRALLGQVSGVALKEGEEREACCGFGGLFCVKYPDISGRMVDAKVDDILATGADTLLAGDLGCLMNIAGRLQRRGSDVRVRHVAEVLANMTDGPSLGEPGDESKK